MDVDTQVELDRLRRVANTQEDSLYGQTYEEAALDTTSTDEEANGSKGI